MDERYTMVMDSSATGDGTAVLAGIPLSVTRAPITLAKDAVATSATPDAFASPLLRAAAPVLAHLEDRPPRRQDLAQAMRRFSEDAAGAGCSPVSTKFGSVVLSAMIAERTGFDFGEKLAGGGASVGRRLDAMRRDPAAHVDELVFFMTCCALGFERIYQGRSSSADHPPLHAELYRVLRRLRGPAEALSPPARLPEATRTLPVPIVGALVLGMGLGIVGYIGANRLGHASEAIAVTLADRLPAEAAVIHRKAPPETAGPLLVRRIKAAFAGEIESHTVSIIAARDGALVIRLFATSMFPIDGDTISARHRAVADKIAAVLENEPGTITVVGHIDDLFAPTARFPTPVSLTAARAEAVRRVLADRLGADRLSAEGAGDSDPIAPNSDAAHRALNRRIEIRLQPF